MKYIVFNHVEGVRGRNGVSEVRWVEEIEADTFRAAIDKFASDASKVVDHGNYFVVEKGAISRDFILRVHTAVCKSVEVNEA